MLEITRRLASSPPRPALLFLALLAAVWGVQGQPAPHGPDEMWEAAIGPASLLSSTAWCTGTAKRPTKVRWEQPNLVLESKVPRKDQVLLLRGTLTGTASLQLQYTPLALVVNKAQVPFDLWELPISVALADAPGAHNIVCVAYERVAAVFSLNKLVASGQDGNGAERALQLAVTSSDSFSASNTRTVSPSRTSTWSKSLSRSPTSTISVSSTPSSSPTFGSTLTPTPTTTSTVTQSRSRSPSASPSVNSATPSPSVSPTSTPSPGSASLTASESVSSSDTASHSASVSATPSHSDTASTTKTVTPAPSLSAFPSLTPSQSQSLSATTSSSLSSTPSASTGASHSPSISVTTSLSKSKSVSASVSGTASTSISGSISVSSSDTPPPSASDSVSETVSESPTVSDSATDSSSFGATPTPTPTASDTASSSDSASASFSISVTASTSRSTLPSTSSAPPSSSPTGTSRVSPCPSNCSCAAVSCCDPIADADTLSKCNAAVPASSPQWLHTTSGAAVIGVVCGTVGITVIVVAVAALNRRRVIKKRRADLEGAGAVAVSHGGNSSAPASQETSPTRGPLVVVGTDSPPAVSAVSPSSKPTRMAGGTAGLLRAQSKASGGGRAPKRVPAAPAPAFPELWGAAAAVSTATRTPLAGPVHEPVIARQPVQRHASSSDSSDSDLTQDTDSLGWPTAAPAHPVPPTAAIAAGKSHHPVAHVDKVTVAPPPQPISLPFAGFDGELLLGPEYSVSDVTPQPSAGSSGEQLVLGGGLDDFVASDSDSEDEPEERDVVLQGAAEHTQSINGVQLEVGGRPSALAPAVAPIPTAIASAVQPALGPANTLPLAPGDDSGAEEPEPSEAAEEVAPAGSDGGHWHDSDEEADSSGSGLLGRLLPVCDDDERDDVTMDEGKESLYTLASDHSTVTGNFKPIQDSPAAAVNGKAKKKVTASKDAAAKKKPKKPLADAASALKPQAKASVSASAADGKPPKRVAATSSGAKAKDKAAVAAKSPVKHA